MRVTYITRAGGRKNNEDCVGEVRKNNILCVVVCDGLGGHSSGETASKTVVKTVMDCFSSSPELSAAALERYIQAANQAVMELAQQNEEYYGMASTVAVLIIKGRKAMWASVGDSRLYRLCRGRVAEVTEDHSVAFENFKNGLIEYDDIRRSEDQNKLLNAVGTPGIRIYISEERYIDRDTAFVICTDGWWEYVTEEDMERVFSECSDSLKRMETMIEIRERNAPSNSDNYTAAIICSN